MEKQIINGLKKLLMRTFTKICVFFLFISFSLNSNEYTPISAINGLGYEPAQKEISMSSNGMVTTQHLIATKIGEKILSQGGNAYDASIAIAFSLAVVLPRAGNIGGGGFMVLYDKNTKSSYSIDFREKAPLGSTKNMYLDSNGAFNEKRLSTFGYLAIGVPGTVAGLWDVHQKFGSLPWSDLLEDSIQLSKYGFEITPYMADVLNEYREKLSFYEPTKKIFMKNYPIESGQVLKQIDLSNTLTKISKHGKKAFYEGSIATAIENEMKKNNGLITKEDLLSYEPVWRKPLTSQYKGTEIITMGPPSSGGIHIIQMLNILENFNLDEMQHNSADYINLLAETMKYAYADRSKYLGDPDFFDVPVDLITSKKYASEIAKNIKIGKTTKSAKINPGMYIDNEGNETTHFSVVDKYGNIVSATYTLNSTFGSGVVIDGTGIVMNNEMDDFAAAPGVPNQFGLLGAEANEISPLKRPLSSMSPTIVMKDNELFFTTGSPGGSRIISAVLQSILNIIDFNMNLKDATYARRIHHQWQPDILNIEFFIEDELESKLVDLNYDFKVINPLTNLQTIMYKDDYFYGFGDFRRPDSFASGNIND